MSIKRPSRGWLFADPAQHFNNKEERRPGRSRTILKLLQSRTDCALDHVSALFYSPRQSNLLLTLTTSSDMSIHSHGS